MPHDLSQAENTGLPAELVKLAGEVGRDLKEAESLQISFMARSFCTSQPVIQPGWHYFPSEDWPLCAKYVASVTFARFAQGWHHWTCPQADMGRTRQTSDKFHDIFTTKEAKVRTAMSDPAWFVPGVPTWLLIVSDLNNDSTSHLFPTSQEGKEELFKSINTWNFAFENSPFSEVWLYAEFGQARLRLFPPP
jgi:hypothetical protein